jgi:hypothetical protein
VSEWRAAAWFLTNSIRGRYLKSARATRPEVNISVADIARTLAEEGVLPDGHRQNGAIISESGVETTAADISGAVQIREGVVMSGVRDDDGGLVGVNGDGARIESRAPGGNGDGHGPVSWSP